MPRKRPVKDERQDEPEGRGCAAVDQHLRMLRKDREYRWRREQIGKEISAWTTRYGRAGLRTGLIRIPVVVHVVHNTPAQNISDAQINSQIAALNADFRRLNADAAGTPAAFAAVAADARIEFALAVRDPDCNATNGILRVPTSVTVWGKTDEGMKSAATGGSDPWDVEQYLNIWVVNYTPGVLGYATFPGMPANIQGAVCDYRAFGTTGTLTPGAHLGRTMTHEIGHWLDLSHIWGNDGSGCTGSDEVADTPNQAGPSPFSSSSCRVFPAESCSNGPNGDMFMNYMDYSADHCMNMFTAGQAVRMDAALHTQRTGILASPGLVPPGAATGPDLWLKDTSDDTGEEPNPSTQAMWISDDIWVRTGNDGLVNHDHQNPEYRTPGGAPNNVYVRVRNRACTGTQSGTVRLYWAKASSGLSWPAPWDGSVTSPALMGSPIGSATVTVAGGDDEIVSFPWMPPNPADYASFGADRGHFCLLARVETDAADPFGMTFPETTNLYANVQNNNNIAWKNITVVDEVGGTGRTALTVANYAKEPQDVTLRFTMPEGDRTVLEWGRVLVTLPAKLLRRLKKAKLKGAEWVDEGTLLLVDVNAALRLGRIDPGEVFALDVQFVPGESPNEPLGARVLMLDVEQYDGRTLVGGVRFALRTRVEHVRPGRDDIGPRDGATWIPDREPTGCGCCC
ncbi:MAG TPA: zinc metalloprotease [Frankiaceae bacterium]|nr:zinc metalloprotease [Frankiaceae bacterium]